MASVDQSRENNMVTLAVISESSGRSARKERNAFYENWSDFFCFCCILQIKTAACS